MALTRPRPSNLKPSYPAGASVYDMEIVFWGISGTSIAMSATWLGSDPTAYTQIWMGGTGPSTSKNTVRITGGGGYISNFYIWNNLGTPGNSSSYSVYGALRDQQHPAGDGTWIPAWWPGCNGASSGNFNNPITVNTYGISVSVGAMTNTSAVVTFTEVVASWINYGETYVFFKRPIKFYLKGSDGSYVGGTSPDNTTLSISTSELTEISRNMHTCTKTIDGLKEGCHYQLYAYVVDDPNAVENSGKTRVHIHPGSYSFHSGADEICDPRVNYEYAIADSNVSFGEYDCYTQTSLATQANPTASGGRAEATGETIKCWPQWNFPSANRVSQYCVASIGGQSYRITSPGSLVYFIGLTRGTTYTINFSFHADYEMTWTTTSTAPDGTTKTESHTKTWSYDLSDSTTITTYKISLVNNDQSTKAIKMTTSITHGADKSKRVLYEVKGGASKSGTASSNGGSTIVTNLPHNSSYTVSAWIDNMRNEKGQLDTLESFSTRTKNFTLTSTQVIPHQHSIETYWQAKANGSNYDKCNVTGDPVSYSRLTCESSRKSGVLSHKGHAWRGTSEHSNYKYINITGLDYFTVYYITYYVTDGYNVISASIYAQTLFPYCRLYSNGNWYKAMPYVHNGTRFIPAPGFIYNGSKWMESNAE